MPKTSTELSPAAAAIAEVDGPNLVTCEFAGETYTFKMKMINSPQWRRIVQKLHYETAIEWLLGKEQADRFFNSTADEDGCTPNDVLVDFLNALGEVRGAGNS